MEVHVGPIVRVLIYRELSERRLRIAHVQYAVCFQGFFSSFSGM